MEEKYIIGFLCLLCLAIILFWILYLYRLYSSPIYGQIDTSIPIADISSAGSTFDGASE